MIRLVASFLAGLLSLQTPTLPGPGPVRSGGAINAAFINSGQCVAAIGTTNCSVSSLSIPSGSLIVVGVSGYDTPFSVSDSNTDSPSCTATIGEVTNGNDVKLCLMKAGATVTSVTCTQSNTFDPLNCTVAWYSPGSLTGVIDQSTGQDQPNITTWTSGNTATLTGSNDLVIGMWGGGNTAWTSTYSDGGTQRLACTVVTAGTSCGLEDRNVSGTSPVASSGSCSLTGCYFAAAVMAIK